MSENPEAEFSIYSDINGHWSCRYRGVTYVLNEDKSLPIYCPMCGVRENCSPHEYFPATKICVSASHPFKYVMLPTQLEEAMGEVEEKIERMSDEQFEMFLLAQLDQYESLYPNWQNAPADLVQVMKGLYFIEQAQIDAGHAKTSGSHARTGRWLGIREGKPA